MYLTRYVNNLKALLLCAFRMPASVNKKTGFTLAEVCVTLGVLSLVSTFTVTKVLTVSSQKTNDAIFKETVSMLSQVMYEGLLEGSLNVNNIYNSLQPKINATKVCSGDSTAQQCWFPSKQGWANGIYQDPGVVLASGANVLGLGNSVPGWYHKTMFLDANGENGPNKIGFDQLVINICPGPNPCTFTHIGNKRPGAISPSHDLIGTEAVDNMTLYMRLFG
jgi:type II secretory pathway pseudopilin PulG